MHVYCQELYSRFILKRTTSVVCAIIAISSKARPVRTKPIFSSLSSHIRSVRCRLCMYVCVYKCTYLCGMCVGGEGSHLRQVLARFADQESRVLHAGGCALRLHPELVLRAHSSSLFVLFRYMYVCMYVCMYA